jgi:hypothetical protein
MTTFKVLTQNVGGAGLESVGRGGNIAPLRISVHNKKPDTAILTEKRIDNIGGRLTS